MLSRRGFSLVELMVSVVLLAIVGIASIRIMQSMMNTTSGQVEIARAQGNGRSGVLALPQELREVGFDTLPMAGNTVSDLETIAAHRLTVRAMRGLGTTCGTPTLSEFRIRKPVLGLRPPLGTDGFLLYVESDPNLALDDQWVPLVVSAIDFNSTCGADSAIALTLAGPPVIDPGSGTAMAISQYFVGGPVRWYERMEYGPMIDPVSHKSFVGARSLSLGEPMLRAVIGPIVDTSAFTFTYFDPTGTVLNPASATPIDVRSIGVSLTTIGERVTSLAGTTKRTFYRFPVTTRVALRNTLRP
jgi:prepilin-type N-terminal cleavage/methylation domain-containing protein